MVIKAGRCHYAAVDGRRGGTTSAMFKKKEKSLDIKNFEWLWSFQPSSSIGLGRHAFPGVRADRSSPI